MQVSGRSVIKSPARAHDAGDTIMPLGKATPLGEVFGPSPINSGLFA